MSKGLTQRKFLLIGMIVGLDCNVKLISKPLLHTHIAWLGYTEKTRKDKLPNANITT